MIWIKNLNVKKACFVVMVNVMAIFFVFIVVSCLLRTYNSGSDAYEITKGKYDTNTIRATYPNYKDLSEKEAFAIFHDFAAPGSHYSVFTGWRRNPYKGSEVTVESGFNTRLSMNHSENDSVWFFGGSTMWGTGSSDEQTIPSYFAKITGEKVWNLGESGYNSFQELIQLQILLVKGLKPKAVIFYDGVNDTIYCNANVKTLPTHSRFDQYSERIKKFGQQKSQIKKLEQRIEVLENRGTSDFGYFLKKKVYYFFEPYIQIYQEFIDTRAIGISPNKSLKTGKPFLDFKRDKKYKICGDDPSRALDAAKTTVRTWLLAYDILEAHKIPVYFILQPNPHIHSTSYKLDYLLNSVKQRIADGISSYESRYAKTKMIWSQYCGFNNACDSFLDLSELFVGIDEPIFIDTCHVSPNGNRRVAEAIAEFIDD